MKNPKVSVIVPNYNHSAFLPLRIDSILQQTFEDFELILLDDCSSDNSKEVLLSYQLHPRISHIILNDENSGSPFVQWNKGINVARGEYIWIAESDDYADIDFLRDVVSVLESSPDIALAFTGSHMVDNEGNFLLQDWDRYSKRVSSVTQYEGNVFLLQNMLWSNRIYNASMVVFRKRYYYSIAEEYMRFKYCGDWLFWIEICRQGKVVSINKKMNYFRQHDNKVSPKAEKNGLYFLEGGRIIEYMINLLNLSSYQKVVVSGRTWKRLVKVGRKNKPLRRQIQQEYSSRLLKNQHLSVFIYELDKILNISGLQH